MNIKKSLKIALIRNDITAVQLAEKMGVTRQRIYSITQQKSTTHETIEKLCKALDMKVSEFIALGED